MKDIRYLKEGIDYHCRDFRRIEIDGYSGFCHKDIFDFLTVNFSAFNKDKILIHPQRKSKRSKILHWKMPFYFGEIDELTCKVFQSGKIWKNLLGLLVRSKAEASFRSACLLLDSGLDTPLPFAWLTKKDIDLAGHSIYITERLQNFRKVKKVIRKDKPETRMRNQIIKTVAAYTDRMHNSGMIHRDLNLANFLLVEKDDHYRLTLIDLNRVRVLRHVSAFQRMLDLGRLYWKQYEDDFIEQYCRGNKKLQRFIPFVRIYQRWRRLRRRYINYFK